MLESKLLCFLGDAFGKCRCRRQALVGIFYFKISVLFGESYFDEAV